MNRSFGWLMAAGLVLGSWSVANAQVAISTPYPGPGVSINTPFFSYSSGYYGQYPGYPDISFGAFYLTSGIAVPNVGYYGIPVPYAYNYAYPGLGYSYY